MTLHFLKIDRIFDSDMGHCHFLYSTCDFDLFLYRQEHLKNDNREHCHFLKMTCYIKVGGTHMVLGTNCKADLRSCDWTRPKLEKCAGGGGGAAVND